MSFMDRLGQFLRGEGVAIDVEAQAQIQPPAAQQPPAPTNQQAPTAPETNRTPWMRYPPSQADIARASQPNEGAPSQTSSSAPASGAPQTAQAAPTLYTAEQVSAMLDAVRSQAAQGAPQATQTPANAQQPNAPQNAPQSAPQAGIAPFAPQQGVAEWTNDSISKLTPAEVNANWDSIAAALKRGGG